MTDEQIFKALEEAVEQKKAICSIYDSALILTRESAESIIEAYKSQKAEIEKYEKIKATMDEFWDILLKCKVANRKEKPTLEELADSIHEIELEAIKEFAEMLKEKLKEVPRYDIEDKAYYAIGTYGELIDNLVKEMEGESK